MVYSLALEAGFEAMLMPLNPNLGPDSIFAYNMRLG
jgi:hypothetical protein